MARPARPPLPTLPPGDPLPVPAVAAVLAAVLKHPPGYAEVWLRRRIDTGAVRTVRVQGVVQIPAAEARRLIAERPA